MAQEVDFVFATFVLYQNGDLPVVWGVGGGLSVRLLEVSIMQVSKVYK